MAEFVQTMKDWRRMCNTIQSENQKRSTGGWCNGCPLQGLCIIDTSIKDSTNGEFDIIGEQIQTFAAEHPEPVYPRWCDWLAEQGVLVCDNSFPNMRYWYAMNKEKMEQPISADIAEKLGLQPKEVKA